MKVVLPTTSGSTLFDTLVKLLTCAGQVKGQLWYFPGAGSNPPRCPLELANRDIFLYASKGELSFGLDCSLLDVNET